MSKSNGSAVQGASAKTTGTRLHGNGSGQRAAGGNGGGQRAAGGNGGRAPKLLEIERVYKRFGGIHAVEDCTLEVEEGSITGLIGPNGAGKTTLFNMIAGALRPTSGSIRFLGQSITGEPSHRLFERGLVRTFQIPHEFTRMTCLENLLIVPLGQRGEALRTTWTRWPLVVRQETELKARAEEVLDFLAMGHLRDELAANVSGGQKKLLEIGRTMMTETRLVLLDEPGAGVNRTLLGKIKDLIRTLNSEQGYTFFIIEHDMDLITELCDPVICMAEGSVLMQGSMEEVRRDRRVLEAYLGAPEDQPSVSERAPAAASA